MLALLPAGTHGPRPPCAARPWPKSCLAWWAVGGPGWGAVCCTWGRGKAARRAHAASSAHPSMPTWPYHLGRSGEGMRGWQAGSPEGRGGLAGAAQDPCLLSSLPSLWAASSSQGLSGPGRGCSALSVSPWQPPPPPPPTLWRWQCSGVLVLGVCSEQLGLPCGCARDLVLGTAAGACAPGTVPPWCSGPSWGPGPRSAPVQSRPESVGPGSPGGGPRGAERAPASLLPSLLWLHVLGSQQAWISPRWQQREPVSGFWLLGWGLGLGCGTDWREQVEQPRVLRGWQGLGSPPRAQG